MGHDSQFRDPRSARLDSWKEIAAFLHRDARTVRRWERERGLPVHRVPGGERSGVFAYVGELQSWLHTVEPVTDAPASDTAPAGLDPNIDRLRARSDSQYSGTGDSMGHAMTPISASEAHVSAIHSLNTFDSTSLADPASPDDYGSSTRSVPHLLGISQGSAAMATSRSYQRHYQSAALVLLLTVAVGISAAVVHFRQQKQTSRMTHQPCAEAQDLYLRGRYYWNLRTEEGLNSAVDLFTQAIVNDPNYAAAYAGLADCYLLLRQYGHMQNSEAFPRALAAARQAVALDDASPEAHRSLAFILRFWDWDMTAAESEYRRAIELNPNDSQSHHWYATALLSSGRNREALAQIDLARSLEPQSVSVLADRGLILSLIDLHEGIQALQLAEQADPAFVSTHRYLSEAYLKVGDYAGFLAESRTAAQLSHDSAAVPILARAEKTLAARGAKPMLREMAVSWAPLADQGTYPAYNTAHLFSLAGDPAQALRYLRLSRDRRDPGFLNVENDSAFASLRSSPEYLNLLEQSDVSTGSNKQPVARLDTPELAE